MSADDPRVLAEHIKNIRSSANKVSHTYRWLYPMGYERAVRYGEKVTVSGVKGNDDLLISTYGARRCLEEVTRRVADAEESLRLAEISMRQALGRADPREGFEQLRYPRSATRADMAEAHEARLRRHDRGEAIP